MKIQPKLRNLLLAVGLATAANSAFAAYINFIEDVPVNESPFTVSTNMDFTGMGMGITINADGVTFDGKNVPDTSNLPLLPGTYIGGLLEPGAPNIVSDLVVLTASLPPPGPDYFQPIHIDVFSIDSLLSDVIAFAQTTYGLTLSSANFLIEDGTLQDISGVMGTLQNGVEGITVRIQSAPEPSSLLLLGVGWAVFAGSRRKKTVSA